MLPEAGVVTPFLRQHLCLGFLRWSRELFLFLSGDPVDVVVHSEDRACVDQDLGEKIEQFSWISPCGGRSKAVKAITTLARSMETAVISFVHSWVFMGLKIKFFAAMMSARLSALAYVEMYLAN